MGILGRRSGGGRRSPATSSPSTRRTGSSSSPPCGIRTGVAVHDAVLDYVAHAAGTYALGGHVLDIGGRDVNGTLRHLFPDAESYTVVDINEHPTVDIVADAATMRLTGRRFDVIVCTEVLEHTPAGAAICET